MVEKKKFKSLLDIPVKVEMQPVAHKSDSVLTVDQLQEQIEEARKGKARVDSRYVDYAERGHLFEYKHDYVQFLDSMRYIIEEAKKRKPAERYQSEHKVLIK